MLTVEVKLENQAAKDHFLNWMKVVGLKDYLEITKGHSTAPNTVEVVADTIFLTKQYVRVEDADFSESPSAYSEVKTELNGDVQFGGSVHRPEEFKNIVPGMEGEPEAEVEPMVEASSQSEEIVAGVTEEETTQPFAPEVSNEGDLRLEVHPQAEFSPDPDPSNTPY